MPRPKFDEEMKARVLYSLHQLNFLIQAHCPHAGQELEKVQALVAELKELNPWLSAMDVVYLEEEKMFAAMEESSTLKVVE